MKKFYLIVLAISILGASVYASSSMRPHAGPSVQKGGYTCTPVATGYPHNLGYTREELDVVINVLDARCDPERPHSIFCATRECKVILICCATN